MTSVLSLLLDLPILYTMAVFTARERRELARVIESDRERERESYVSQRIRLATCVLTCAPALQARGPSN